MPKLLSIVLTVLSVCIFSPWAARGGTVLITEQEASLPKNNAVFGPRGITRGPRIELAHPDEATRSPMRFHLKFRSFGGNKIKTETLRVVYLRSPEIDITRRMLEFVQPAGIDIPDAEAPVGEHSLRVEITDSEGKIRSSILSLRVLP